MDRIQFAGVLSACFLASFALSDIQVDSCSKQTIFTGKYSTSNELSDDVVNKVINNSLQNAVEKRSLRIEQLINETKSLMSLKVEQEHKEDLLNKLNRKLVGIANQLKNLNILSEDQKSSLPRLSFIHKGYRYTLTKHADTWENVRKICQSFGGDLAFKGINEVSILQRIIEFLKFSNAWIGLSDIEREGDWKWVDNSTINGTDLPWSSGQPDNEFLKEHCGQIWHVGILGRSWSFNDGTCESHLVGLCQIK